MFGRRRAEVEEEAKELVDESLNLEVEDSEDRRRTGCSGAPRPSHHGWPSPAPVQRPVFQPQWPQQPHFPPQPFQPFPQAFPARRPFLGRRRAEVTDEEAKEVVDESLNLEVQDSEDRRRTGCSGAPRPAHGWPAPPPPSQPTPFQPTPFQPTPFQPTPFQPFPR